MSIKNAKISCDGSHYVATDSASYPHRKGKKAPRAPVTVEREEFDKAYEEAKHLPKSEKKRYINEAMDGLFRSPEIQEQFIAQETAKKVRNFAVRRQRLFRKINLQHWDYFCTFTYDSAKHSEESFKKGLLTCLRQAEANARAELSKALKRNEEIDAIIRKLYEDNVMGRITDERFDMMSKSYEAEQAALKERISYGFTLSLFQTDHKAKPIR